MNDFDLNRIIAETAIAQVDYHAKLGSTNDQAIKLLRNRHSDSPPVRLPLLVLTAEQTAGRGQHDRIWRASKGSLTCTICLPAENAIADGLLPMATALAVCRSLESVSAIFGLKIKWPNDVLVENRKLAGILIEKIVATAESVPQSVIAIGIGINVNNDPLSADAANEQEARSSAISVGQYTGRSTDLTELQIQLLQCFLELHQILAQCPAEIVRQCRDRSNFMNQLIDVRQHNGNVISGTCIDLGARGELIVESHGVRQSVFSGTIMNWQGI